MPWTLDNPPSAVKNKPKHIIEVCVIAANSALSKGLTEEEAIFACLGAAKRAEKSTVSKSYVQHTIPQHVQVLLNREHTQPTASTEIDKAFLGKSALPPERDRNLVKADFNSNNELVLTFNTGEKIITRAIEQNTEQYINVSTGTIAEVNTLSPVTQTQEEEVYAKRTDVFDDSIMYKGEATVGAVTSAGIWRIRKIVIELDGDISETWANGTANFDKVWDDRLTYTYS